MSAFDPRPSLVEVSRLIHLNGPPGVGKSTIARRYVEDHHGVLNCDIDVLRTLVGGWQADFGGTGALIRSTALAMITDYLSNGRDVVLPQLIVQPSELARIRAAADRAGAEYFHCLLLDQTGAGVDRFRKREIRDALDAVVRDVVAANGGDDELLRLDRGLRTLARRNKGIFVIDSQDADIDGTYAALLEVLDDSQ
jgi:predicted kinase